MQTAGHAEQRNDRASTRAAHPREGVDIVTIETRRQHLLRSTILGGLAAAIVAAAPVLAQDAQPAPADPAAPAAAEDPATKDKIVITGSRIARDPTTAPTPLIQLDKEEILRSGEPNVVDFLADIPALSGSIVPEDTTGANLNDGGLSLLNLRDLGTVRTLVLVDGRRHVGSSPGTLSVDVDTIPSVLVDSVEVVTGGQSAVYGADAVSGVVNFLLRRDFTGIELDGAYSQINQDGQDAVRLSGVIGHNFFNDKLNVYGFAERQEIDEVLDFDIDWRRESWGLNADDADPASAPTDGDFDTVLFRDRRDAFFARGGILVLSNQPQPSATNDPDTPFATCPSSTTGTLSGNCTAIRADQPGTVWVFNPNGSARAFDFGSDQPDTGFSRRTNIGGDGLNSGTEFGQGSRVPKSDNNRFQAGLNFNLTPDLQLFAEAKYVEEETTDSGQPTFFQITLQNAPGVLTGSSSFRLGLDNAFLNDGAPDLVQAILANTRPVYGAPTPTTPGQPTGQLILDQRAFLGIFGPSRSQFNQRDLTRYVIGVRGDRDKVGFVDNVRWELGYTYGEMNNSNFELGVDSERFFYATDAVRDPDNLVGNGANAIVCRVQLLVAQNGSVPDIVGRNGGNPLTASDPAIRDCVPTSLFGTDFRADANHPEATGGGGRPGLTQEQADYLLAGIEVTDKNRQEDFVGFVSGEFWDFWGAGPIGLVGGYEYRKEETEGTGRDRDTQGRLLFLNTGPDFPVASYDSNEVFVEGRLPLFKNWLMMESGELSGAYRYSDYSTVGEVETTSFQLQVRPNQSIYLRTTYGEATRIPNLGENFRPPTQTFGNGLLDPCDANRIRNRTDLTAAQRDQLRANCLATMPSGYDPGTDAPNTGTIIQYTSGIPGFNAGNPNLEPEESTSFTFGFALTPTVLPDFTFTADYYYIDVQNVIASVTVQQAMNQCVGILATSIGSVNPGACGTFERSATPQIAQQPAFGVFTFIQGSLNYASTLAEGIDFTATYDWDLKARGNLSWALRGNHLIRQTDFVNIASPTQGSDFDGGLGLPHLRFLSTLIYEPTDKLSFAWDWDWQASQQIIDKDQWALDPDQRPLKFIQTEPFSQHDFSVSWRPTDQFTLRGGVVNAFDAEPDKWLGSTTTNDNFDFFGRRYYVGLNFQY